MTILACRRGDYQPRHLRRLSRPSRAASITPRLHLSPNEARSELSRDSQITRIGQGATLKMIIKPLKEYFKKNT